MNIPTSNPTVSDNKAFPIIKEGSHVARIYQIIDLGTKESFYQGETRGFDRYYSIRFETPKALGIFGQDQTEQPYAVSMNIKNKITSERSPTKSLLDNLIMATGAKPSKEFNVYSLLGQAMLISVVHTRVKDKTYANIKTVSQLPDGLVCPEPVNNPIFFCMDREHYSSLVLERLPSFLQEQIMKSPEYEAVTGNKPVHMISDEEFAQMPM